jgi:DNA-binding XRE family transcriptional regulator
MDRYADKGQLTKNIDILSKFYQLHDEDPTAMKKMFQLNQMYNFAQIKSENPKLTQDQIAKKLGVSRTTLYRTRKDLKLLRPNKTRTGLNESQHNVR